jgi:hypothetical protein
MNSQPPLPPQKKKNTLVVYNFISPWFKSCFVWAAGKYAVAILGDMAGVSVFGSTTLFHIAAVRL